MSATEQWSKDKPPKVAAIAITLARSAPEVSEALSEIRDQVDTFIAQPNISDWLMFYRQHRSVLELLGNLFTLSGMKELSTASATGNDPDLSPTDRRQLMNLYTQPLTLFFLKVWAPCGIYYKATPIHLLRQARLGKISAFEKLLRIDNSIIYDKKLSEIFHQLKAKNNKKDYRKLLLAFHKPVKGKSDPKHIKTLASAAISLASESLGGRLTEPQIRQLFDAIARDRGQGLQDEDIPEAPETFAQGIRRETKKMKKADKKPYKR